MTDCRMHVGVKIGTLSTGLLLGMSIAIMVISMVFAGAVKEHRHYYAADDVLKACDYLMDRGIVVLVCSPLIALILFEQKGSTKEKITYAIYFLGCTLLGFFLGLALMKELMNMDAWERFQAVLPDHARKNVGIDHEIVGITGSIVTGGGLLGVALFTKGVEKLALFLEERAREIRKKLATKEIEEQAV